MITEEFYIGKSLKENQMKVKYSLSGMTCGHCAMTVQKIFAKEGIQASADFKNGTVELESEANESVLSAVKMNLDEEGYSLGSKV